MAYLFVVFSAISSALFGQTYKRKIDKGFSTSEVLTWFSLAGILIMSTFLPFVHGAVYTGQTIWLPVLYGAVMSFAMYTYYAVIEKIRLGISWTVVQLSVVFPFFTSIVLFSEPTGLLAYVGFSLIIGSILLFGLPQYHNHASKRGNVGPQIIAGLLLFAASFFTGVTSSIIRIFAFFYPEAEAIPSFFVIVFATQLLLVAPIYITRIFRGRKSSNVGLVLRFAVYKSVTNLLSMGLLLLSVQFLPGYFVFPVKNSLAILFVVVISKSIYKEEMNRPEIIGLGLGVIGMTILSFQLYR